MAADVNVMAFFPFPDKNNNIVNTIGKKKRLEDKKNPCILMLCHHSSSNTFFLAFRNLGKSHFPIVSTANFI